MNDPKPLREEALAGLPALLVTIVALLALVHGLARAGQP